MRLDPLAAASSPALLHDAAFPSESLALGVAEGGRAAGRPATEIVEGFLQRGRATDDRGHSAFVLRDLAMTLLDLSAAARVKATVRHYDDPWELCVERFGATACASVYRAGPEPTVAVLDHALSLDDLVCAARAAIARRLDAPLDAGTRTELELAAKLLRDVPRAGTPCASDVPPPTPVSLEAERDAPLAFAADFALRAGAPPTHAAAKETVERADLHALLFRGRVRAEIRGRSVDLGEGHPVLVAERLVELAKRAFDAWERGLAFQARSEAAGVLLGIRVAADGELSLTLGTARGGPRRPVYTFPALGVADVLEAALAFGRSLVRALLRRDRAQAVNLRLSALRRTMREASEALRSASRGDSKVNPAPEPYRAFAAALAEARAMPAATASTSAARLRYAPRWRTIIPGIDLRATYLCGDRVIVGAATEMWALDRQTGQVLWRSDVPRGTSVVTPGGVARLAPDGSFAVYDFGTGERTLRARVAPRGGAPVAGAVVHLPGLPKMVVLTEGDHHLVALDLSTGEPRWRWSWGSHRGTARRAPRMKRAGRLLYFTCGDGAVTALDIMTGAVVWRLRDRLRFRTPPTVGRDALFVVSGGAHGVAKLYCVDPYSGAVRWVNALAEPASPCTIEGAPLVASSAVGVVMRHKNGVTLSAFRPDDGSPVDRSEASPRGRQNGRSPVAPVGTSWLAVDDAFIGNAPTGELVAVDARTAALRWRHLLGPRPLEADVPRRLEPVLRGGALFVPCSLLAAPSRSSNEAHEGHGTGASAHTSQQSPHQAGIGIVRPADGAWLGAIAPTETIPDLLRVDEHCHVYIAEESGHLSTFAALPRLSLVTGGAGGVGGAHEGKGGG